MRGPAVRLAHRIGRALHATETRMVESSDLPAVVFMMSRLAAILWTLYASARGVARGARRTRRRPWLWVLIVYTAVNVVIGLAGVVLGRGR